LINTSTSALSPHVRPISLSRSALVCHAEVVDAAPAGCDAMANLALFNQGQTGLR
jgi:hypothetical protein